MVRCKGQPDCERPTIATPTEDLAQTDRRTLADFAVRMFPDGAGTRRVVASVVMAE
jgi:hypothetical protein